jgi:hypothetical protein
VTCGFPAKADLIASQSENQVSTRAIALAIGAIPRALIHLVMFQGQSK